MHSVDPIDHIVFDVGNVLFHYDPDAVIEQLIPNTPYRAAYLEHLFYADIWQVLDRGDTSTESAINSVLAKIPNPNATTKSEISRLLHHFPDVLTPIHDMITLFKKASQKTKSYILSNFQAQAFDRLHAQHDFFNLASGMIISAKENRMKPEAEIYTLLIERFHLIPGKTIFIDDRDENIEAAKQHGIRGILYTTPAQVRHELAEYGVQLDD